MPEPDTINLLGLNRAGVDHLFDDLGEKRYRTGQLMKWLYHQRVRDFAQMTNLSKSLREQLANKVTMALPEVVSEQCQRHVQNHHANERHRGGR